MDFYNFFVFVYYSQMDFYDFHKFRYSCMDFFDFHDLHDSHMDFYDFHDFQNSRMDFEKIFFIIILLVSMIFMIYDFRYSFIYF